MNSWNLPLNPTVARKLRELRSIKGPVILFVVALALALALLVLWNVVLAIDYRHIRRLARLAAEREGAVFHWTFISIGTVLFLTILSLLSIIGAWLFQEIRYSQRLSSFIATFTHELNSPLASVKLFVQTLRNQDLEPVEQRRFLDLILLDIERLRAQISNVLRSAEVESPTGIQVSRKPLDMRGYLTRYVSSRAVGLERGEQEATLSLLPGPSATVDLDDNAFRQILDNLVDNALKYEKPGGVKVEVAVMAAPQSQTVIVEVRDDGVGIPEDDLELVFERFARARRQKPTPRKGTGLGLWIVRWLVEAHGGTISALSDGLNQGTTVRIELPRYEAAMLVQQAQVQDAACRSSPVEHAGEAEDTGGAVESSSPG
ncbi:sensor histidine kinase [Planctomycetota bacterium]